MVDIVGHRFGSLSPALLRVCLDGGKMGEERKWERKMGWGKYFPMLGWGENGRGKKMGEEKWVGHMSHFPSKFFLPKWGDYKREKSCITLSNNYIPHYPPIFLPSYFPSSIQAWWGITFSLPFSFLSIFSPPIFFPLPFSLHPSRPLIMWTCRFYNYWTSINNRIYVLEYSKETILAYPSKWFWCNICIFQ